MGTPQNGCKWVHYMVHVANRQPWLMFCVRSLVEREKIVLARMPQLALQIVEFFREHGRVTIGELIKLTGPRVATRSSSTSAHGSIAAR